MTPSPTRRAHMHVRIVVLILLALFAGSGKSVAASTYAEAGRLLDGEWSNETFVLRIDAGRAQASMSPERPFEWKRFLIKEANGNEVVFTIGAELFVAIVEAGSLTLTGTSFRGERVLFRDPDLRGAASD